MDLQIKQRVAVVTGGSSGIGLATLQLLLAEGCKVAFCGRSPAKLQAAQQQLSAAYPQAELLALPCDVLEKQQVTQFADSVIEQFGQVDMLINNAGQGYLANFDQTPETAWLDESRLKLFGVLNPLHAFLPYLKKSTIGSVTCVNSLLALQPEQHMIATSAARAALLNMTLTLSKSLIEDGIRVNSILLGMVESGQWQRRFANRADQQQDWHSWIRQIAQQRGIPMQRLGKPEEAARALVFLASPMASFTTGASIDVSGGFNRHL